MFLLPFVFIILEVLAFTTITHFYDFWDILFIYAAPSFLGIIIFSMLGRKLVATLQGGMRPGQLPSDQILNGAAMLVGSVLLIVPLATPRLLAIFLIVPGFRHFSIFIFKTYLFKNISKSAFTFVKFGGAGAGGPFGGGPRRAPSGFEFPRDDRPQERDAEVVNVTPIEITHTKIKPGSDSN